MLLNKLVEKGLTNTGKLEDNFFSSALYKYDTIPQNTRTPTSLYSFIHASQLSGFCARRAAILQQENRVPKEYVTGAHKVVWAMGRAAEQYIRDGLLDTLGKSKFFGVWECKCGNMKYTGTYTDEICNCCNKKASIYNEYTVTDDNIKTKANPDLIYIDENGVAHVIEIKSMNKKDYEELKSPVESHARQGSRYVYLLRRSGMKVSTHVTVIYVCKEFFYGRPYKEFTVDTSLAEYTVSFDDEVEELLKYVAYTTTEILPEKELCQSVMSPMAKKCPACNSCFAS